MPRKTEEEKAGSARQRWDKRFANARREFSDDPGKMSAPLEIALRWLMHALSQRKDLNKKDTAALYRQAAEQIAAFAKHIQTETENGR